MITLDTLHSICQGFAWSSGKGIVDQEDFEVTATLPFPFYDQIQRELLKTFIEQGIEGTTLKEMTTKPMNITTIRFPTGIMVQLIRGDEAIIIETRKAKVIPITDHARLLGPPAPNGTGLKPRA